MFTDKFPGADTNKVRAGATIKCTVAGILYTAKIYRDDDCKAPDEEQDGFWPSLDPNADGYIGSDPARSFEVQQAGCEAVMARYRAGKMIHCGVAVTASKAGVELTREYDHALWRVDINWPWGNNDYLTEVANELLADCRPAVEKALVERVAATRETLAALESVS